MKLYKNNETHYTYFILYTNIGITLYAIRYKY